VERREGRAWTSTLGMLCMGSNGFRTREGVLICSPNLELLRNGFRMHKRSSDCSGEHVSTLTSISSLTTVGACRRYTDSVPLKQGRLDSHINKSDNSFLIFNTQFRTYAIPLYRKYLFHI
jgi:hypothetical protein